MYFLADARLIMMRDDYRATKCCEPSCGFISAGAGGLPRARRDKSPKRGVGCLSELTEVNWRGWLMLNIEGE